MFDIKSMTIEFEELGSVSVDFQNLLVNEDEELGLLLVQYSVFTSANMHWMVSQYAELELLAKDSIVATLRDWLKRKKMGDPS
jgi:hypothetical protein